MSVFVSGGERESYSWWVNSPVCVSKSLFGFLCSLRGKKKKKEGKAFLTSSTGRVLVGFFGVLVSFVLLGF